MPVVLGVDGVVLGVDGVVLVEDEDVDCVGAVADGLAAPDDSNGVVGTGNTEDVGDSGVLQL
jgi:hypothetical protein